MTRFRAGWPFGQHALRVSTTPKTRPNGGSHEEYRFVRGSRRAGDLRGVWRRRPRRGRPLQLHGANRTRWTRDERRRCGISRRNRVLVVDKAEIETDVLIYVGDAMGKKRPVRVEANRLDDVPVVRLDDTGEHGWRGRLLLPRSTLTRTVESVSSARGSTPGRVQDGGVDGEQNDARIPQCRLVRHTAMQ